MESASLGYLPASPIFYDCLRGRDLCSDFAPWRWRTSVPAHCSLPMLAHAVYNAVAVGQPLLSVELRANVRRGEIQNFQASVTPTLLASTSPVRALL